MIKLGFALSLMLGSSTVFADMRFAFSKGAMRSTWMGNQGSVESYSMISGGQWHTCGITTTNALKCWGRNDHGQLGTGDLIERKVPTVIAGAYSQVVGGFYHTCALRAADGGVDCWGYNVNGQIGDGTFTESPSPVSVSGITNATQISAGNNFTCALLNDQTVKCWGYNLYGQLGNGNTTQSSTPVLVSGLSGVIGIAAGGNHTCAWLATSVKCWGYNAYGQLGNNSATNSNTPVDVSSLGVVNKIGMGQNHTCAIESSGTIKCWGANSSGQLGTNDLVSVQVPTNISDATSVYTDLELGNNHSCGIAAGNTLKCWGDNTNYRLGFGGSSVSVPTVVNSIVKYVSVFGGAYHSCGIVQNSGALKCWGGNSNGQIGDGTVTDIVYPKVIDVTSSFTSFSNPIATKASSVVDGSLDHPNSMAIDWVGKKLLVADTGNSRINVYDLRSGTFSGTSYQIENPKVIRLSNNKLFVLNDTKQVITILDYSSGTLSTPTPTSLSAIPKPGGIAIFGNTVYVSDPGNKKIWIYQLSGSSLTLQSFSVFATVQPMALAMNWAGGKLFLIDASTNAVKRVSLPAMTEDFTLIGASLNGPSEIEVDHSNNIYVTDSGNRRVVRYDLNGNFSGWIGQSSGTAPTAGATGCLGLGSGKFTPGWCSGGTASNLSGPFVNSVPTGLAMDQSGTLFIAVPEQHRIVNLHAFGR